MLRPATCLAPAERTTLLREQDLLLELTASLRARPGLRLSSVRDTALALHDAPRGRPVRDDGR